MGGPNARLARGGYVRPDVHSSTVPDFADDAAFGSGGFHPGSPSLLTSHTPQEEPSHSTR